MPLSNALNVLMPWPRFAERYWCPMPDQPAIGCFGTGYNGWGVQTNQKYLASLLVLASDPAFDEKAAGMSREQMLERALQALRFSFASHQTGKSHTTDGSKWGHTWVSGLGIERMMHGIDAIYDDMTQRDLVALRRMLVSEADWLLGHEVQGTVWASDRGNKPESNIWNGAILARTAMMFPDERHAPDWTEKGNAFLINGISIRADATDDAIVAGKPVRDRHVGPNFFDHYALDHHGYLNVGYMVICLSNIAMLHYGFKRRGEQAPESLYHHAKDLWALVRRLIFSDGRLCRIGGDSRQRYCYCQDYLLPALVFAADYWRDPHAATLAQRQIELIAKEQEFNRDGSFLSARLSHFAKDNWHYYCRLESDKAVVLSMAAYWARQFGLSLQMQDDAAFAESFEESVRGGWAEPEHSAVFHRSPTRIVSWSWRANLAESPQGLCLPPNDGHLAEWARNLAGAVVPAAERHGECKREQRLAWHKEWVFERGFSTIGEVVDGANVYIGEGWSAPETARHQIAFVALPDEHTAVRLEYGRLAARRVFLAALEGVRFNVPNDIFNGMVRSYATEGGVQTSRARLGEERVVELHSRWVNVEDRIGLIGMYGGESWSLIQQGQRAGGYRGSILCDVLCWPLRRGFWDVFGPAVVLDAGCVIVSSVDADRTRELHASGMAEQLDCTEPDARAVRVRGVDGATYIVAANFSTSDDSVTVDFKATAPVRCLGAEFEVERKRGRVLCMHMEPGTVATLIFCEGET